LFQPDKVSYVRNIHTPGFTLEGGMHIAPPDAFICHFDCIPRSFGERRAKLLRYEAALPGCGSSLLFFYLPELLQPADRREAPFETGGFDARCGLRAVSQATCLWNDRSGASRPGWSFHAAATSYPTASSGRHAARSAGDHELVNKGLTPR
jgi:hypothetical protein